MMHGVIIEKGPKNWQIMQQKDGYATVLLAGKVGEPEDILAYEDIKVVICVVDENTNAKILEPYIVMPQDKTWEAKLRIPAGGSYRIDTYLQYNGMYTKRGDRIRHLGVGDNYLIAGQSNAVGFATDFVNDPISSDVHVYRLSGEWDIASHPLHDDTDAIFSRSIANSPIGHSPWITFGKLLSKQLGYPIGLFPATVGGIPLSCWDRQEDGKFFENALEIVRTSGSELKGIIWYQGCSDTGTPELRDAYFERFERMCKDFCATYGENIPILTVQLNKEICHKDGDEEDYGYRYAVIREAQRKAMHEIENVFMAPSIDLKVCDGIHNSAMSNLVIGERVARLAMKHVYGMQVLCDAPDIREAVLEDVCSVRLIFDHVYGGLRFNDKGVEELMFSITDENGRITPCDYFCPADNSMVLYFEREIGKQAMVNCDGYNKTGLMPFDTFTHLPMIPFYGVDIKG